MIRKIITICAALASLQSHACGITLSTSSEDVRNAIRQNGWGFNNYHAICEKLRKSNAALVTDGFATVLGNKSVAWAHVGLKDKDLMVFAHSYSGTSTNINDYASIDKAKAMLLESINQAVNSMDIDKAIQSLNENRKQAKAAYSR